MKTRQTVLKTLAITAMTIFVSGTAFAHSGHDRSSAHFKWEFSKKLNSKIERDLNSKNPTGLVGLKPFEQKKFEHYGVKVGNTFNAQVRNVDVTFKRTSSGLRIVDASKAKLAESDHIVPIRNVSNISKVSTLRPVHAGHDHSLLKVEWVFGASTNAKIVKHMFDGKGKLSVGLTYLEQKMLNEYGIERGNQFHLFISGHSFLVERTSSGLKIINHIENTHLAKASLAEDTVDENI